MYWIYITITLIINIFITVIPYQNIFCILNNVEFLTALKWKIDWILLKKSFIIDFQLT